MATIAPATSEDGLKLAEIQFDAFSPSIIHQTMFGEVKRDDHVDKMASMFSKSVDGDGTRVHKAVVRSEDGKESVVGLALWELPKNDDKRRQDREKKKKEAEMSDEEKRKQWEERFPVGTNYELAASYFDRVEPKVDEPYYRLSLLAIDPATQRTGAGAKLLEWGCREADKAGVAMLLEASDVGVGLYRKWGFEMFGEPIVGGPNNEMTLFPMRRPPLELRTFRRSDFPAMCDIYYDAFEPSTIWKYNFANVTRQASHRCFKRRLENWFDEIDDDGNTSKPSEKKEVIVATRGNQVLGFAKWDKISEDKANRGESETRASWILPEGADEERTKEFLGAIEEAAGEHEKRHWYLGLLAVRPTAQRGGIGRVLTQWGIDRARKDGFDVVLGATEFGKGLYAKMGFEEIKPIVAAEDSSVMNWIMVLRAEEKFQYIMSIPTRHLADRTVGAVGSGWMRHDWTPKPTSDEQAFESFQTALSLGSTFWNSGAFYSSDPDNKVANLERIARFVEKHPEHRDSFFLSVKGGLEANLSPNADLDFLRKDCESINKALGGRKMDLYEMARVDTDTGIEQSMKNLLKLREEGHFKYIGLSECSADTIRRASAIAPISAVEVEFSPFCPDIRSNGVLEACKEFGIAIIGYSPLGAGFLSGQIKSNKDFDDGDMRKGWDRFSDENMPHNLKLVESLQDIAEKKGITSSQLSVAWVLHQSDLLIPLPGSTRAERVKESIEAANVKLTQDEIEQINKLVDEADIKGVRYMNNPHLQDKLWA
ncbi:uncharacterized protein JCM6883_005528 [Sporobolomyces salmoneus]|uniref:uncharacterized protein n=1 Tax=Sporobolomyces salmoneus TaxID=183962 RepID=UPI0031716955